MNVTFEYDDGEPAATVAWRPTGAPDCEICGKDVSGQPSFGNADWVFCDKCAVTDSAYNPDSPTWEQEREAVRAALVLVAASGK